MMGLQPINVKQQKILTSFHNGWRLCALMIGLIVGASDVTYTANVDVGRGQQTDDVSRDRRSSAMIKNTKSSKWFIDGSVWRRYKYLTA